MTDTRESSTTISATADAHQQHVPPRRGFYARRIEGVEPSVLVYALGGVFTDSKNAYEFLDRFRQELGDGTGAVIVDFTAVTQMTSCGVGILAAAYTSSLNAGRAMALAGMRPRLTSVMQVVGLLSVIPHYDTRAQALAATRFRTPTPERSAETGTDAASSVTDGASQ